MIDSLKAVFLICDGAGDRPIAALGGFTPLESARTPNFNLFAERGITGIVDPIGVGVRPGSDIAHLSLFGYDPKEHYPGRGPLEALGVGITLKEGDVAFRMNFATQSAQGKVVDRRAGRIKNGSEFEPLLNKITLSSGIKALFKAGPEHRGALVFRGKALSDKVSSVEALEGEKLHPAHATDGSPEARETAAGLNEYLEKARVLLEKSALNKTRLKLKLPAANCLLARGAGAARTLPSMKEKWGFDAACIAGGALEKGIGRALGMQLIPVKGATGRSDTDLLGKMQAARRALETHDFVFVHVKAADSFSHDGDYLGKKSFIERIDAALTPLLDLPGAFFLATADHSSPCELKKHSGDPVPLVISGPGVRKDAVRQFGERECARGGMGRIKGLDVMPELLNLVGRAPLEGA